MKAFGRYPWPSGLPYWTYFNVGKGTKKYCSHQIGSKLGVGREQVGINIKFSYKLPTSRNEAVKMN